MPKECCKDNKNIWMVGDNPNADIIGGKKINAITIQKIHKGIKIGKNESEPDIIFDNFFHLSNYFNECLKTN